MLRECPEVPWVIRAPWTPSASTGSHVPQPTEFLHSWVFRPTPFLDQAPGGARYTVGSAAEAICGRPQRTQGEVRDVGEGLRGSDLFPFGLLSEGNQR